MLRENVGILFEDSQKVQKTSKNTKNMETLTQPFGRCLVLPDWVAIIIVFRSSRAVCNSDIALSRAKRRPALVSP